MNAANSTAASAGMTSPRKNAVSVAATRKMIQGPRRISSWIMSWRSASTSELAGVRDVVRGATLAVGTVAADAYGHACHKDPERVAPDVLTVLAHDPAAQPIREVFGLTRERFPFLLV